MLATLRPTWRLRANYSGLLPHTIADLPQSISGLFPQPSYTKCVGTVQGNLLWCRAATLQSRLSRKVAYPPKTSALQRASPASCSGLLPQPIAGFSRNYSRLLPHHMFSWRSSGLSRTRSSWTRIQRHLGARVPFILTLGVPFQVCVLFVFRFSRF